MAGMKAFHVTYDITDSDNAEDYAETGYASPGGWQHDDPANLTLSQVLQIVSAGTCEDGGSAFYTVDSSINYRTGEETRYAVHPPRHITRASYNRLRRIFCGK